MEYVSGMYNEKKDYPTAKYYMDDKSTITVGKLIMDSLSIFIKNKYHQPARARWEILFQIALKYFLNDQSFFVF